MHLMGTACATRKCVAYVVACSIFSSHVLIVMVLSYIVSRTISYSRYDGGTSLCMQLNSTLIITCFERTVGNRGDISTLLTNNTYERREKQQHKHRLRPVKNTPCLCLLVTVVEFTKIWVLLSLRVSGMWRVRDFI